jgi:hypothetical protein
VLKPVERFSVSTQFETAPTNQRFAAKFLRIVGAAVAFIKKLPTVSETDYKVWTADAAPPPDDVPSPE